ncbi:type II toxin-antitoxin system CcdA family antitoxin [Rhizobium sp. AB2/73]|uniref:type II toxin-antitoxin system CcdA family antitoxin n=1 Tax=Rhizobium sp. AB2/73 TaxID=2795216 RepID=UPI000DDED990|nr:type II toxin-antitoxin system CcdA family antitoxin [Rhizobium sp. AB2/73]QYA13294.1 type II toxin-antitoxin system CcdA family antitoxin [Rhizobium sp. AB2/73]UEQ80773.1 type II toxin-antitoxin system CcdA family antitoxin [Rhizobium sp. AB2/73]
MSDSKNSTSPPIEDKAARVSKIERGRLWLIENAEPIAKANACVERYGLPFAQYRQF